MKEKINFFRFKKNTFFFPNVQCCISVQYYLLVFDNINFSLSLWKLSSTTSDNNRSSFYFLVFFSSICFSSTIGYFTCKYLENYFHSIFDFILQAAYRECINTKSAEIASTITDDDPNKVKINIFFMF